MYSIIHYYNVLYIIILVQKMILSGKMWMKNHIEVLDSLSHRWQLIASVFLFM